MMSDWAWVDTIALPLLLVLLGGGLLGVLIDRADTRREVRRWGYAEAVAAVYAWYEYPYQIRRRTSDRQEVLDHLVGLGHDNQQRIAKSLTWVAADSRKVFDEYRSLVRKVQSVAGPHIKDAWGCPPIANASDMNLNGWGPPSIEEEVMRFLGQLSRGLRG